MEFWQILLAALALMLIVEGMLPFLSPDLWRRLVGAVLLQDNRVIRGVGLVSMVVGAVLLNLVRI